MSVYKKANIWYIDYYVNYKRFRESVGPGTKRDALKALAKRKVQIKEDRIFDMKVRCHLIFDQMAENHLKYSRSHKRSFRRDEMSVKALGKHFGGKRIVDITPSDVEDYKQQRAEHKKINGKPIQVSTVNREISFFKTMYNRLIRDRVIDFNPVKPVKLFNEDHLQRDRILSDEEFWRLHAKAAHHLKPILEVAYYTGMRRGEILNLRWDQLDLKNGFINLNPSDTKTNRKRVVPLLHEIIETLRKIPRNIRTFYVFNLGGNRIGSFKTAFKAACRRAGIKDFRFHDLRHTAITRWVKAGIPETAIMMISGHRTRKVFDRYVNLKPADIKAMLGNLQTNKTLEIAVRPAES